MNELSVLVGNCSVNNIIDNRLVSLQRSDIGPLSVSVSLPLCSIEHVAANTGRPKAL